MPETAQTRAGGTSAGWTSAGWRAEAVAWLDDALAARGARRTGEVEQPRVRPWATVLTAPTTAGRVWLKASGPDTAFEAGLYLVLREVAAEWVLDPIGVDADRGWVLLPDGGPSLGAADGLADALVEYARLQRRLFPHVGRLLAAGVSDMRPAAMPRRLEQAVSAVRGELPSAFTDGTAAALVADWSTELAASSLPPSLDHNDLHEENVLSSGRFYDWGDSVVAHPFAAALHPLGVIRGALGDTAADTARDRYLEEFTDHGSPGALRAELDLACRLAIVARTLTWARAAGTGPGDYADAPRLTLLSLLEGR
jgi:hypothetical protein